MPVSKFKEPDPFEYLEGFNSYHQSEAVPGTIPVGQNLPQRLKHDLFPERISGTGFTAPRKDNKQTWLCRLLPSNAHDNFVHLTDHPLNHGAELSFLPNQTTWLPLKINKGDNFLTGLRKIGGAGEPEMKRGVAYYAYTAGKSMDKNTAYYSADGDFVIIPQLGSIDIQTELGHIRVRPNELCVIPRGFRYNVSLVDGPVRGFALEAYSGHFDLPELDPIGSVGLAKVRDFQAPKAAFVDSEDDMTMIGKFCGKVYSAKYRGNVFNVVAWHGTYYPYKYDLGEAAVDLVVFPPRWLVMENSFRPPYFHRNTMSEFSFVIKGSFDATPMPPQLAGLFTVANNMSGHGVPADVYEDAISKELKPEKIGEENMAFMFESCYMIGTTKWAEELPNRVLTHARPSKQLKKAHL